MKPVGKREINHQNYPYSVAQREKDIRLWIQTQYLLEEYSHCWFGSFHVNKKSILEDHHILSL